jgi:hypothetical protein
LTHCHIYIYIYYQHQKHLACFPLWGEFSTENPWISLKKCYLKNVVSVHKIPSTRQYSILTDPKPGIPLASENGRYPYPIHCHQKSWIFELLKPIWVPTPLDILKCHGLKNTKTSQTESKDRFPQLLLQRFALLPQFGRRRLPSDLGEAFRASEGWLQGTSAATNGMV